MPTTSPDNIFYADNSTAMSAAAISAAEATSIQNALDAKVNDTRQIQTFVWADTAARNAQTGMIAGDFGYQTDTGITYRYNGSAWVAFYPGGTVQIIPTAATNGSVSATGVVTSTAQSLVRVRTAFPTAFNVFQIDFDLTTASASGVNVRLAVNATDASTAYDNQRFTSISITSASVQTLNQTELQMLPIALAGRHVGRLVIHGPNVAAATYWNSESVTSANPMTASAGRSVTGGLHRTATAYNSINFYAASGDITVNRLTVKGLT